jgi:sulfite dehydrogenase (cytochrome) subunit B
MRPVALLVCAVLCAATPGIAGAGEETIQLKDGAGRELTAARCAICHSLDYIQMNAVVMSRPDWEKSIRKMIDRFGAPVSEDEAQQIVEYLAQQY